VLGPDGISDFEALHAGKRNAEVRLYAFDLLRDWIKVKNPTAFRLSGMWRAGRRPDLPTVSITLRPGPKTQQRQFSRSTGASLRKQPDAQRCPDDTRRANQTVGPNLRYCRIGDKRDSWQKHSPARLARQPAPELSAAYPECRKRESWLFNRHLLRTNSQGQARNFFRQMPDQLRDRQTRY